MLQKIKNLFSNEDKNSKLVTEAFQLLSNTQDASSFSIWKHGKVVAFQISGEGKELENAIANLLITKPQDESVPNALDAKNLVREVIASAVLKAIAHDDAFFVRFDEAYQSTLKQRAAK